MITLHTVGVISDDEFKKASCPGLERAVPKNKGAEVGSLLHQLGVEVGRNPYGPNARKLMLEIDPNCKDRLAEAAEPKPPSRTAEASRAAGAARRAQAAAEAKKKAAAAKEQPAKAAGQEEAEETAREASGARQETDEDYQEADEEGHEETDDAEADKEETTLRDAVECRGREEYRC